MLESEESTENAECAEGRNSISLRSRLESTGSQSVIAGRERASGPIADGRSALCAGIFRRHSAVSRHGLGTLLFVACLFSFGCESRGKDLLTYEVQEAARGPLKVSSSNPRYFTDGTGKLVYLSGIHTWNNFQDWGTNDPPPAFDYASYLACLHAHSLNFFRLWTWEQAEDLPWSQETVRFTPLPYLRTGPGIALDGAPKFDLTRFNDAYFTRLRERVLAAQERGIYVSIMLFNGFSVADKTEKIRGKGNPWRNHPYNGANNINGIDGDPNGDGQGFELQTLDDPKVVTLEEAYVARVIDTVQDLDNVLYEISNESNKGSRDWEYEMIQFVHRYERTRREQHPVGMTVAYPDGNNDDLWKSDADWISPTYTDLEPYRTNPPLANGSKVVVADTDHLWGIGGDVDWVWKSFCRGLNTLFMDPYSTGLVEDQMPLVRDPRTDQQSQKPRLQREWAEIRRSLAYTRIFSKRMNFESMTPQPNLASSGYCLAATGSEYLIYLPRRRWRYYFLRNSVSVDLGKVQSTIHVEWFDPASGKVFDGGTARGGASAQFRAPFWGPAVLHLGNDRRLNPS